MLFRSNISSTKDIKSDLKTANDLIWETGHLKSIWEDLQKELSKADLSEENRLQKQQELNDITERLVALYPDMINKEDMINGKWDERIDKVQKLNEWEKKLQTVNLKKQNLENAKNFDKVNQDYINSKEKVTSLEKEEQKLNSAKEEIQDLILESKTLEKQMQALENKRNTAPNIAAYNTAKARKEQINYEMDNIMKENGFEYGTKEGQFLPGDIAGTALEAIDSYMSKLYEQYAVALEKDSEIEKVLSEWRNSELQQIEIEYGEPIEQAIQKYDEMDAAGQAALENAIRKVMELDEKYKALPEKITTELMFKIVYSGVQPQDIMNKFMNPIGTGISTAFDKFKNQNVDKKAAGGIVNKAHIGMIGEAGPEAIIPLSGTNQHRGISLWQQAGEMLGMLPKHAQGGIFGGSADYKSMFEEAENKQQTTQSSNITISLGGMNFTFTSGGTDDKESIIAVIRQQMPEIANEVAETIAKELQKVLPNMKANIASS